MANIELYEQYSVSFAEASFDKPRTSYTYFPKPQEMSAIARADVEELRNIFFRNSKMAGRFLHELWRNGRYEEIAALSKLPNSIMIMTSSIKNELLPFAFLALESGEDRSTYMTFLAEAFTAISNGVSNREYNAELPDDEKEWVVNLVDEILPSGAMS